MDCAPSREPHTTAPKRTEQGDAAIQGRIQELVQRLWACCWVVQTSIDRSIGSVKSVVAKAAAAAAAAATTQSRPTADPE